VARAQAAPRRPIAADNETRTARQRRARIAGASEVSWATASQPPPPAGIARWVRAVRVRQWPKNLLVFGAPAADGALGHSGVLGRVALAALAFCLLSSGTYLLNDLRDAREDRRHPVKRLRPIASRAIAPGRALVVAAGGIGAGLALSAQLGASSLAIAGSYALLSLSYTTWLRRVAIADIVAIAGAFVIRAAAGGVAAGIPISRWFFVVVSFAALFVAAGKRYADFLDPGSRGSRAVLAEYNADFLRMVIGMASAVCLGAYCLWAFQTAGPGAVMWREATIIPFTIALLRYGLLVTGGGGGAPEEIMLGDRFMQLAGLAWLLTFGLGL
jgi:decaprenyl-phosphate phosphoribosyltransferase